MSIYEIEVLTVSGDLTTLEDYKGQLLLTKDLRFLGSLVINLQDKNH